MAQKCVDQVVGDILAGWRYDISGIAPEMCSDYVEHFRECAHCRSRQRLHRVIDFALLGISTASATVFLIAFGAIHHLEPRHALVMEVAALSGLAFSALMWILVAIATPVPVVVVGVAKQQARRLHDRLPEEIRSRIPEPIVAKIAE